MQTLSFRAGPGAMRTIREAGFSPARIGSLLGASGGAKWLVLSQLDRVFAREILPHLVAPVFTLGSSIGAWRFACLGQADPLAAIDRFEAAYLAQTYSERPDSDEITARSHDILDTLFGHQGVGEILEHPVLRTNIMCVRSRHLTATEGAAVLGPALGAAALSNLLSRRSLGAFFERALFSDPRDPSPFADAKGFPLHTVPLSSANVRPAVAATGSIPMLLNGVRDIPGAPPGMYRDGGVIDYHLDLPQSPPDGRLALYFHFIDRIVPGWFDKRLTHRRAQAAHVHNTLLISPSAAFVATLPNGKIPDRKDFTTYPPAERERHWRVAVDRCRAMADELSDVLATGTMGDRLEPLLP
ncbi:MAG: patatin-like phospholipase family protein [Pseudomonadota bacterium]